MKPDRCQATAASGKTCSATPRPGRSYCLWHDPAAAEERRELARRGGAGRSNAARARKALPAEALTLREGQGMALLSAEDLERYPLVPIHREILRGFLRQNSGTEKF